MGSRYLKQLVLVLLMCITVALIYLYYAQLSSVCCSPSLYEESNLMLGKEEGEINVNVFDVEKKVTSVDKQEASVEEKYTRVGNVGRKKRTKRRRRGKTKVSSPSPSNKTLQVEIFPAWTTKNPYDQTFTRRLYIYSAIVAIHRLPPKGTDIHLSSFQDGHELLNTTCCLVLPGSDQVRTGDRAQLDFAQRSITQRPTSDLENIGVVYRCWFPYASWQLRKALVTLTPSACPVNRSRYLTVHHPEEKPGGLAICAKVAYGLRLDPYKLIEWFEMQRLLGVDKIQVFDLSNTMIVRRIFRHYQDTGLLEPLPYKLPGRPWGRFVLDKGRDWTRFGDDKNMVCWECRLRLAGYRYVMSADLDEVILPRHYMTLKPFLEKEFAKDAHTASLNFMVQLFLNDWEPADPNATLQFLKYLKSSKPSWLDTKHVYMPARVHQAHTHYTYPYEGYRMRKFVNTSDATVFHYRKCKKNYKKVVCKRPKEWDSSILRFKRPLIFAVSSVRRKLGLQPVRLR